MSNKEILFKDDRRRLNPRLTETDFQEILIIKPSSLGDIIDALPAVGAIRRRFEKARISWLVKSEWAAILKGHPSIDKVISVPFAWRHLPQLIRGVQERPFDLVVDLQGLLRSAFLGYLTKAPVRVGFAEGREGAPWFYTDLVSVPAGVTHAIDRYLMISKALGGDLRGVDFGIASVREAIFSVNRFLKEIGLSGPFVVIHPTARWKSKKWDPSRFARVSDWLTREKKIPVVFIGSHNEKEEIDQILSLMKEPAFNAAGKTALSELAELIRQARFFISNDSGPMHLAAAVGTPVFALFGPTDPKKVGPYGPGHTVIQRGDSCAGCRRGRCIQENKCMKAILVGDLLSAIEERWDELVEGEGIKNLRRGSEEFYQRRKDGNE